MAEATEKRFSLRITVEMAGASPDHNQIAADTTAALHAEARERGCRSAASGQRIRSGGASYAYPDFVLV